MAKLKQTAPPELKSEEVSDIITDIILPSQAFQLPPYTKGQQRLMVAMLTDAIDLFLKYSENSNITQEKNLFKEARDWIDSNRNDYLYAFLSICDHLHLDPDYLRRGIRNFKRRKLQSAS